MKVIVTKQDLKDALARVMPAVAVKPQEPIISGIYFSAQENQLEVRATNFQQEIRVTIPANVEVNGAVCVVGKYLVPIIAKLAGEIVTLTEENKKLQIKSDAAQFELMTMDADDFPREKPLDAEVSMRFQAIEFKESLKQVVFCASRDISRPIFMSVLIHQKGAAAQFVATNTHRVGRVKLNSFDEITGEKNLIVPVTACHALINSLDNDSVITVSVGNNRASFYFGNELLTTVLAEGTFPPVDKLFDLPKSITAEINIEDFLAALDRVGVIARQTDYTQVTLEFTPDGLTLKANSMDIGSVVEHVDINLDGQSLVISFNINYLWDTLRALTTKTCRFAMNVRLEPVKINGVGDDDAEYVITPVRTQ